MNDEGCARDRSAKHQDAQRLGPEGVEPGRNDAPNLDHQPGSIYFDGADSWNAQPGHEVTRPTNSRWE